MGSIEADFHDWLRRRASEGSEGLCYSDDMGMVCVGDREILMSSDMLLDGVHFDSATHRLEEIGHKAAACCLSDCAAMAVRPVCVTLSIGAPRTFEARQLARIWTGAQETCGRHDVALVGGDTTTWDRGLVLDAAILATPYEGIRPVGRHGAKPGDRLFVTGRLGGSILGHHMSFAPRVDQARILAEALGPRLHAMIDITDGLSLDAWRLCEASGVGAVIYRHEVEDVARDAARDLSRRDGVDVVTHVLRDGEDFELLLAVDSTAETERLGILPIGCVVESGFCLRGECDEPIQPSGYLH